MRLGVLGLGSAGQRHALNALKLGHEVFAYDPGSPKSVTGQPILLPPEVGDRYTRAKSRDKVLAESEAVIIATPSECHLDDLTACLAAGKHVLVEKPLGLINQRKDLQRLIESNTKAKNPLTIAVGYNLRFHPNIAKTRETIAGETAAGRPPYYGSFVCCQYTETADALAHGCLETWATHEIDLAEHLLGPLRLIDHHVDHTTVNLGLQRWEGSPCFVAIHSDMRARGHMRQVMICTEGLSQRIDLEAFPATDEHYRAELEAFIARINGDDDDTLASGADGIRALQLAERAMISGLSHDRSPGGRDPNRLAPSGSPPQQ